MQIVFFNLFINPKLGVSIQPPPKTVQMQQQPRIFNQSPIQNLQPTGNLMDTAPKFTPAVGKIHSIDETNQSMDVVQKENSTILTAEIVSNAGKNNNASNSNIEENGDDNENVDDQMMGKFDMQEIGSDSNPDDMEI